MSNNQNILAKLADFDVKYTKYIYCNDSKNNLTNCSADDTNMNTLTDAYNKLVKKGQKGANLKNLNKVINKNKNDIMTNEEYLARYNGSIKRYNRLVNFRRRLDDKMKILYNVDNKITYDNNLLSITIFDSIILSFNLHSV